MAMKEKLAKSANYVELSEALVLTRTRAQDLESVKKLNCWASNIGDVSVVRRMPNLEVCSLSINKLTTLRDFAHCHHLKELYVRTNSIEKLADIHYLKNLHKLRSLWLSENPCASGANYRMTVLKTLPNLQKLDNVVVTEDEISRAEEEGDDLLVPEDFSASALFNEVTTSSEDSRGDRKNAGEPSVSSEKWALPRQKRQQRKREDLERERKSFDEDSGSGKSGDDGSSHSGGSSGRGSRRGGAKISPRSDDTGNEDDDEADKESDVSKSEDRSVDDDSAGSQPSTSSRGRWAMSVVNHEVSSSEQDKISEKDENSDNSESEEKEEASAEDGDDQKSLELDGDGDVNYNKLTANRAGKMKDAFPVPQKINHLSFIQMSGIDDKTKSSNSESAELTHYSDSQGTKVSLTSCLDNSEITSVCSSSPSNVNSNNNNTASIDSTLADEPDAHLNCGTGKQTVYESSSKVKTLQDQTSQNPLLDKIQLEDSLDVQNSVMEGKGSVEKAESLGLRVLSMDTGNVENSKDSVNTAVKPEENETGQGRRTALSSSENKEPVDWEEYNRMRVQLGVKPVDKIPNTGRSVNTDLMRARNSNMLQAVLCLVKELDKDSLDIVAAAVKGRLDNM